MRNNVHRPEERQEALQARKNFADGGRFMENGSIDPVKVVEQQNAIIRIQSGVIDELFLLLMQHISVEETEALPCVDRINRAAQIRAGIGTD